LSVDLNFEAEQDVRDVLTDVEKRLLNPKPLKRTTFPEGFFAKDLDIHIHTRIRAGRDCGETCDFCFALKYAGFRSERDGFDGDILASFPEFVAACDMHAISEMDFPVLIPVRELSEPVEGMGSGVVLALVRLQLLEKCDVEGVHSFGLALPTVNRARPSHGRRYTYPSPVWQKSERSASSTPRWPLTPRCAIVPPPRRTV